MRLLALPPRLAAMAISAAGEGHGRQACLLGVLLTEQGLGGPDIALAVRPRQFRSERGARAEAARALAGRVARSLPPAQETSAEASCGSLLLHAYPDRVALKRGGSGRFFIACSAVRWVANECVTQCNFRWTTIYYKK